MFNKSNQKLILGVSVQIAIILAIVVYKLLIIHGGTTVLLEIAPVDPRDLLRGDYVTFQYSGLSRIDSDNFAFVYADSLACVRVDKFLCSPVRNGDTVYARLSQQGRFWKLNGIITKGLNFYDPSVDKNVVYLKGVVTNADRLSEPYSNYYRNAQIPIPVDIKYGIEEYYIPERRGTNLPTGQEAHPYAEVTIDDNGNAVLRKIFVNDSPWP